MILYLVNLLVYDNQEKIPCCRYFKQKILRMKIEILDNISGETPYEMQLSIVCIKIQIRLFLDSRDVLKLFR